MRSKIAWGEVGHFRALPTAYGFSYSIFTFELDVDELETLTVSPRLFSCNRRALFSVRSEDYLSSSGTLREKVERELHAHGVAQRPARITLITMPRFLGYIFNPVSFFVCFDESERVIGLVIQVNNTFGETHVYPLVCKPSALPVTWRFAKEFFVSPFFDREGQYTVVLEAEGERLGVLVELEKDGVRAFSASLRGAASTLSRMRLIGTLMRFPLASLLTMSRIHLHALLLFFRAQLTPFGKPPPSSKQTIRSRQNIIHKMRLRLLALMRGLN